MSRNDLIVSSQQFKFVGYMRNVFCFINSHSYFYFNSDDSPPPEEMAPPRKVAPWKAGTLDTHLLVEL